MPKRILICTDLDRTLLPNGKQPEPGARAAFTRLVSRPELILPSATGYLPHMRQLKDSVVIPAGNHVRLPCLTPFGLMHFHVLWAWILNRQVKIYWVMRSLTYIAMHQVLA